MNYRPEYQHSWASKTFYQLRMDPLPTESAKNCPELVMKPSGFLQSLKTPLISRTEGNPFFLEESLRTLVETRVLEGERGGYRLAKPIDSIEVPATVQAVLPGSIACLRKRSAFFNRRQ